MNKNNKQSDRRLHTVGFSIRQQKCFLDILYEAGAVVSKADMPKMVNNVFDIRGCRRGDVFFILGHAYRLRDYNEIIEYIKEREGVLVYMPERAVFDEEVRVVKEQLSQLPQS